jgi:hypothetical protein
MASARRTLAGRTSAGANLSKANLREANLSEANLSEANLSRTSEDYSPSPGMPFAFPSNHHSPSAGSSSK